MLALLLRPPSHQLTTIMVMRASAFVRQAALLVLAVIVAAIMAMLVHGVSLDQLLALSGLLFLAAKLRRLAAAPPASRLRRWSPCCAVAQRGPPPRSAGPRAAL